LNILIQSESLLIDFLVGILFGFIISSISYRFKFLTFSGSLAAFFLAVIIYGFGTWQWTIPIVTFFILSSLLSKYRKNKNESVETYFEKTGERDHFQVLANGGLACLLVTINYFNPSELIYIIYLSCIAAVCADTWATEIGTISKTKTIDIISFKKVKQGVSGGVSLPGILGSLAGAIVIAATSLPWIESNHLMNLIIIMSAGFIGSVSDSILGTSVQAKYICIICSSVTEKKIHCSNETVLKKGIRWMNNDAVNFGASISGGLFSIILYDVVKS
jgi:uncharacterized protein (TIGR00297 family)